MNELHLFAGAGGGILGGQLLGHTTVCAVEIEPYCRKVLLQRQRDGMLPKFPIWDDVRTFDGRDWRGKIDVICGGFPCQDISCAGKGAGLAGARSGLWREFARIIGEIRPQYAFVENSPMLTSRGLGRVLGDLSEMGYDATWCVLGAADVGAPHIRKRIWILAHARMFKGRDNQQGGSEPNGKWELEETERGCNATPSSRPSERAATIPDTDKVGLSWQGTELKTAGAARNCEEDLVDTCGIGRDALKFQTRKLQAPQALAGDFDRASQLGNASWWRVDPADERGAFESQLGRVAYGVDHRVDRLKAIGNGQVPLVAATAFKILTQTLERKTK